MFLILFLYLSWFSAEKFIFVQFHAHFSSSGNFKRKGTSIKTLLHCKQNRIDDENSTVYFDGMLLRKFNEWLYGEKTDFINTTFWAQSILESSHDNIISWQKSCNFFLQECLQSITLYFNPKGLDYQAVCHSKERMIGNSWTCQTQISHRLKRSGITIATKTALFSAWI